MLIFFNSPNETILKEINAVITWIVLASDGVGYATLAALAAAGKVPLTLSDVGTTNTLACEVTGGTAAAGSGFYYACNRATAPTDVQAIPVFTGTYVTIGPRNNIWVRKAVATDSIVIFGGK